MFRLSEACSQRNLRDAVIGAAQAILGLLNAQGQNVTMGRYAKAVLECSLEMALAKIGNSSQILQCDLLAQMSANIVFQKSDARPGEASQPRLR